MKKITLALFAAVSAFTGAFGQANITYTAPSVNASTQVRLPDGTNFGYNVKGCMLIPASELSGLTGSIVTSIGMILLDGTDPAAASGNFSVYLQNTVDNTNLKTALGYSTAISTMAMHYNGAITIPTVAATVIYTLNTTPQFTYTGNGIYVCYEYMQTSATSNTWSATWAASNAGTNLGASSSCTAPPCTAPDALNSTNFRPSWVFRAVNTATNEVGVVSMVAPGKVAKMGNTGHVVTAQVRNNSIGTLSNVQVTLNVSGANSFQDVQSIGSIAGGQAITVSFTPFQPQTNGINNMSVSVSADQYAGNNTVTWTQSVTCNEMAVNPPNPTFASSFGFGGSSGSGIFNVMHNVPATASLTGIRFGVGAATQNAGKQIYGVLMDNTGNILSTSTNTITLTTGNLGNYVTFNFAKDPLTANTDYRFGVAQPAAGYYPLATIDFTPYVTPFYYSIAPLAGGAITPITNIDGFFAIEPILLFDGTEITATASKTVFCKGGSEAATITVQGADSYTWNPAAINQNTNTIVWVPTVGGAGTATQVSVIGSFTAPYAAGCRSNTVAITFSLLTCTGLNDNAMTEVKLFPNPTNSGKTVISGMTGVTSITVFNNLGQAVLRKSVSTESVELDLSSLPAGNYLVKLTDAANESRTIKIVNQN